MRLAVADQLFRYRVPFCASVRWGRHAHAYREGLIIRQQFPDGITALGEVAPLPGFSQESLEEAQDALLAGQEGSDARSPRLPASAIFGRETAQILWKSRALGDWGLRRSTFDVCALLAGSAASLLAGARAARAEGYRAVKLKVGRQTLDAEVRLVCAVRSIVGPDVHIRLDANRAWPYDDARAFAMRIREQNVAFVEEPLADPRALPALSRHMPVALDETLAELSLGDLPAHGYAEAIVIKPTILGGISIAVAWAEQAATLGMTPVISAAYETGIGMLGLLYAAGQVRAAAPIGLDTYRMIQRDVLVPRLDLSLPQVAMPAPHALMLDHTLLTCIA